MNPGGRSLRTGSTRETALLARGSAINVVGMALGAVFGFGLTVLASRWLQPGNSGGLFELIAMFTIMSNILELGADTGLTRWISRARAVGGLAQVRRIVRVALFPVVVIGIVVAAAVWVEASWFAELFLHGMPRAVAVRDVRVIAPLMPLGALSNCLLAGPRGYDRMWPYLLIEGVGKPAARLLLVLLALLMGFGLEGALVAWCLPVVAGLIAAWLILSGLIRLEHQPDRQSVSHAVGRRSPTRAYPPQPADFVQHPGTRGSRHRMPYRVRSSMLHRLAAEFWGFAAPRGLAGAFQIVVIWLDVLLVGAMLSRYAAGIYVAVSKLAIVGTYALQAQRLAIGPQLSRLLARQEYRRAERLFQSGTRMLMLATWPLYILLMIFPSVVLGIFGTKYMAGWTALAVLSGAMLINLGTGNVTVVLLMGGKSSWNALNAFAAVAANIGLNFLLVPRIGIAGAAIAWAASIAVDNIAAAIEVKWTLGLGTLGPGYGLTAVITVGCFGLTGVAARALLGENLLSLALSGAVGAGIYAAVLYTARARLQIDELIRMLQSRRTKSTIVHPGRQAAKDAPAV